LLPFFPDPDIPKLKLSEVAAFSVDTLKKELPELPWAKRERYKNDYAMTDKEVAVFVETPELAIYFESIISVFKGDSKAIKLATNYLLTDYLKLVKDVVDASAGTKTDYSSILNTVSPAQFAELIGMIAAGDINSRGAKDILGMMFKEKDASAKQLAEKHNLIQKSNADDLIPIIEKILVDNQKAVTEYKAGKLASLQFLTGQAMKATKGAGNPEVVKKILLERLG
jgi:aspartyl-tRNA(Asn)/glutamyl-tRNA(Gln) amidotransferase subunit B